MQKIIKPLNKIQVTCSVFIGLLFLSSCVSGQLGQNNSKEFKNGMVVSAHPEASQVGIDILKKGGNAVDAAVAVQFALAVVYPNAGNIGGGGFMVYRSAKGEVNALDFREKAAAAASRDMYLDEGGHPIADKSLFGHLAAGVPGSVDGMVRAHQKYGKLSWKELLQPAINLAEKGFKITRRQATELNGLHRKFMDFNPSGTAFVNLEGTWQEHDLLVQKELKHVFPDT